MAHCAATSARLLALVLVCALIGNCGRAGRPQRVVLITLDTLRYDRVVGKSAAMPRLAQAARCGTLFTHSYAATSSTQPSHATLFTGLPPWRHGVTRNGLLLPEESTTLAELLSAHGFATAAVVSSFPMAAPFGWARGFDTFIDDFTQGRKEKKTWDDFEPDWDHFYSQADTVTAEALKLLDAASAPQQFFFFHYFDPHAPYGDSWRPGPRSRRSRAEFQADHRVEALELTMALDESQELFQETLRKALRGYGRDVAFLDEQLGLLLDRLAADADRYETHVVITADHGESFGDDLSFGHGDRLSRQQLHVPLVILSPRVTPGRRHDPNGSIDVSKTLLALASVDDDAWGGRSLIQPLQGPGAPLVVGMRRTYARPARDVRITGEAAELSGLRFYALIDGKLHLGDHRRVFFGDGDPLGTEPIPAERQARLRQLFEIFEAELGRTENLERLDSESQEALQALGYTR